MKEKKSEYTYSSWTHISYGLGGFLDNFLLTAFTVWIIVFYENVIRLPILLIMFALIIYGFWNAINDPLIGFFSDKTVQFEKFTNRWGRRFPWFILTAIPCVMVYLFIFTPPISDTMVIFLYLVLIMCLFEFFYSFWTVNWLSLFPDKFRSTEERTKVGGLISLFGNLGIAMGMLLPPLFISYEVRSTYIIAASMITIISLFIIILMITGMREDEPLRERALFLKGENIEGEPFIKTLKFAVKQKNFVAYLFIYFGQLVLMFLMLSSLPYLVENVLHMDETAQLYISAAFLMGSLISIPLWVFISRKFGNRKTYLIGTLSTTLVLIPTFFVLLYPTDL